MLVLQGNSHHELLDEVPIAIALVKGFETHSVLQGRHFTPGSEGPCWYIPRAQRGSHMITLGPYFIATWTLWVAGSLRMFQSLCLAHCVVPDSSLALTGLLLKSSVEIRLL